MSGSTLRMWQQRSGLRLPEVRALVLVLLGDGDDLGDDQLEPVALDEPLAGLVGLLEEEVRVELDDVHVETELGDHVNEHRGLLLPGADEAEPLAELLGGPAEDVLRGQRLDLAPQSATARRLVTQEHLLQGVGAEPEPERLERDDLFRRDVAEVDLGAEPAARTRPAEACPGPRRRRPSTSISWTISSIRPVRISPDGPVDAGGAGLATLGDHLPRAGREVLPHPLDPLVGRVHDLGVLRADLGEDDEVLRPGRRSARACAREGGRSSRRRPRRGRGGCR